ncbi:EamA family transporter [Calditerricola satsumensis]|uniref:EamA family transporter n=1 Tax=Calditerricola satsumensis TaxID=373054 RepID=UPI00210C5B2F|nr:EamA family transporter [Calditerricola satsumensis]
MYAVATILWLFVLSRVPLSVAYPAQSVAYILGVMGAFVWFGEPITVWKVLGCLLIMAGVSLIGFAPRAS